MVHCPPYGALFGSSPVAGEPHTTVLAQQLDAKGVTCAGFATVVHPQLQGDIPINGDQFQRVGVVLDQNRYAACR